MRYQLVKKYLITSLLGLLIISSSLAQEKNIPSKEIPNYQPIKAKYGLHLTPNQEKYLDQNKFLLIDLNKTSFKAGENFDQMLNDFDSMGGGSILERKSEDTKLVTPDIMLHAYHKYLELTLEQLEQNELSKTLNDFLTSLHHNIVKAVQKNSGYIKERYQTLEAQIILARVLLDNKSPAKPTYFEIPDQETAYLKKDKNIDSFTNAKKILAKYSPDLPPELINQIKFDLEKIYTAKEIGSSPLFSQYQDNIKTDYTQFTPRSHYAKNSILRAYFRTMIYLGRSSYFLKKDLGITDINLLTKQFALKSDLGITPLDAWDKMMTITGFYAGTSDDLTYAQWRNFQIETLGPTITSDTDLVASENVGKMAGNLYQLKTPKIISDVIIDKNISQQTKIDLSRQTLAFKIFGQRFSLDAWILNDLTAGQEKTEIKLPSTPTALFIPAVFGDARAKNHCETFLKEKFGFSNDEVEKFLAKLNQRKIIIERMDENERINSISSLWLEVLATLTHPFDEKYPRYMQSNAFQDKQIQTFLGAYTELKHDTLLYAKQSYAEMGDGSEPGVIPPVVKGFVEPNLDFWNKFNQLLERTEQFFSKNNLFKNRSPLARLVQFHEISKFYTSLAQKELSQQKISDDEYEKLRTTKLAFIADPFEAGQNIPDQNSAKVALVADIHTDLLKGQILYQATGNPYLMLVIIANQTPRLVAGLVYNHYEFTQPIGKRLTDEDWHNWVYQKTSKLPRKNLWYQSLLVK
jgi:hypothetical protein